MIRSIVHGLTIVRHAVAITIVMGAAGATVAGSVDSSGGNVAAAQHSTTSEVSSGPSAQSTTVAFEAPSVSAQRAAPAEAETQNTERVETTPTMTSTRDLLRQVTACVAAHERSSQACQKALDLSGLSADDFWGSIGGLFAKPETELKHEAHPTTTVDTAALEVLIKDCLARYAVAKNSTGDASLASEACKRAITASGLSSSDFWSRFGPKTETKIPAPTRKPEETKKPTTTGTTPTVTTAQLEVLVKDCFTKYVIAKNTKEGATAAYEACNRAIAASGLASTAFWAKFGTPGSN